MKAFIKCPLEAALAAKNHGFLFYCHPINVDDKAIDPHNFETFWCGGATWGQIIDYAKKYELPDTDYKAKEHKKIYIADESLALLEPIHGDRGDDITGYSCYFLNDAWIQYSTNRYGFYPIVIDKRNGLAFPRVEWEE